MTAHVAEVLGCNAAAALPCPTMPFPTNLLFLVVSMKPFLPCPAQPCSSLYSLLFRLHFLPFPAPQVVAFDFVVICVGSKYAGSWAKAEALTLAERNAEMKVWRARRCLSFVIHKNQAVHHNWVEKRGQDRKLQQGSCPSLD